MNAVRIEAKDDPHWNLNQKANSPNGWIMWRLHPGSHQATIRSSEYSVFILCGFSIALKIYLSETMSFSYPKLRISITECGLSKTSRNMWCSHLGSTFLPLFIYFMNWALSSVRASKIPTVSPGLSSFYFFSWIII